MVYSSGWDQVDDASAAAFEAAVEALAEAGVTVISRDADGQISRFEDAIADADQLSLDVMGIELDWPMGAYRDAGGELGPTLRKYLDFAETVTAQGYADRLERRRVMIAEMERIRPHVDAIISLSASGPAPVGFGYTGSRSMIATWTLLGAPAWSLPVLVSDSMPLGLQLVGFRGDDARLAGMARWMAGALAGD